MGDRASYRFQTNAHNRLLLLDIKKHLEGNAEFLRGPGPEDSGPEVPTSRDTAMCPYLQNVRYARQL